MIRIENPKIARFVAESLYRLIKNSKPVESDSDYYSSFTAWRVGSLLVTVKYDREAGHVVTAYTDNDFFFASYYPNGDYGLLTIGRSPNMLDGWDFGGGVDDPKY
jgi:hypothetical protein